jgi:uncharacterized membrane protein YphA (DoxX/SURF4 family)
MSTSAHVQSPFMHGMREGGAARRSIIWIALAVLVGALFVFAGVTKIPDPEKFANDVLNFHIVPWSIAVRAAFYLPWLEILAGLALITGLLRRGALAILSVAMLVFIGATISAHARGINLDCGCFGSVSKGMSFGMHMLIDLALLGALVALWFSPLGRSGDPTAR